MAPLIPPAPAHEEIGGKEYANTDAFSAYASMDKAEGDFGRFLADSKRYAKAFLNRNDPGKCIHEVAAAGYAMASGYDVAIRSISHAMSVTT